MKKKPDNKAEKWMIGIAIGLLIIAFAGIVFLVLDSTGVLSPADEPEETTVGEETTTPVVTALHDDVETYVNDDGTPHRVVYYKDNVYDGSIDYVYQGASVYEIHYDGQNNLLKSSKKTVNEIGNLVYESYSDSEKKLKEIEYTYYDDMESIWKKLTTDHTGEVDITTKELFSEDGLLTDKYVYEDSKEVSHVVYTYDENGEIKSEEEIAK